jgi:HEAT repeat protein
MLRSSRTIASLIRSLMLGTAATIGTAAIATAVIGCKDESQPEYWVDKLDDASWRPRAIKRLEQFFEDAVTRANSDMQDPTVKALLDKTVEALTRTYVEQYAALDSKSRVTLIKLLASYRDPRTEPALKKAFEEFAKRPQTSKDEQDIKWAARAAGDLKLAGVAGPMVEAFDKLRASSMLGGVTYKDFNDAMVLMRDKSWAGPLKTKLDAEIVRPDSAKDKDLIDPYRDQLFWQTTSAEVLGWIGDPSSVEPLLRVLLDPSKGDIQATAALALVKIGKPAAEAAIKLLKGQDENLVAFHKRRMKEVTGEEPKGTPHLATAALVLGTIGRAEAIPAMVEALKASEDEVSKAVIARELAKVPASQDAKDAFKAAFEAISVDTVVPPGAPALEMLAESAAAFYDPSLIDWLLVRAEKATGTSVEAKRGLQSAITVLVLKLAKPDQLAATKAAVEKYGTQLERDLYAKTDKLLKACGDRVSCYLEAIEKAENQEPANQFVAIKAAYMVGIYGNEETRDELIARLDAVENAAVRFTVAQTIDRLSPKGSLEAAKKLRDIIEKNAKSADRNKTAGDAPLKQVMYRLEARAG